MDTLRINEELEDYGIEQLVTIIKENNVGSVVIGLPKNMNNSIGFRGEASLRYKELLKSLPDIEIIMWMNDCTIWQQSVHYLKAVSDKKKK